MDTDWRQVQQQLSARDRSTLTASELDLLADALFWTDRVDESITARRDAYRGHHESGDDSGAAMAAWRLFYDHFLVGETAVAGGWLQRCRRHSSSAVDPAVPGWLALADADVALAGGDATTGYATAERAHAVGTATGDPNLHAMALQALGRAEIGLDHAQQGMSRLDEAMVAVINDELDPLFTGWVYCNVISTCYGMADLRRAGEWSEAAMRWCSTLRDGLMYPGLCRVYAAELAWLRGRWDEAEAGARRACDELEAFDPRYGGEAHYVVGELRRLRGDATEAEAAFVRARRLGRDPQPGMALLLAGEGRADEAIASLRTALTPGPGEPLPRVQLLMAAVEIGLDVGSIEVAGPAGQEIAELASSHGGPVLEAYRDASAGLLRLLAGDAREAVVLLRGAVDAFHELGLRHRVERHRGDLGVAADRAGDTDTSRRELTAAVQALTEMGAVVDARRVEALLAERTAGVATAARADAVLSERELDVLRLVAAGCTNKEIGAELTISPHTVARHVSNITTKLGVGSRAAATARAYELDLITPV